MGHAMMNILTVLLVGLAAVSAVPVHFPRGKTVVYKYTANVEAGTLKPTSYASQFSLTGLLRVKQDLSDPTLKNAYCVTLTDVKHGMHNGPVVQHDHIETVHPIVEAAKVMEDPFLIVYDENGKFQGIKLENVEKQSGWSNNIKQAIASLLQLDLGQIHVKTPMKAHSFITHENTIHGTCQVAYNVHPKDHVHPEATNVFVVTKLYEPKNCSHFVQRVFNHVETETCEVEHTDTMSTASRRVFEVEHQGEQVLIKKLIGHGVINYLPWLGKSEAHYLLTNQTLTLENVIPVTEGQTTTVKFQDLPLIRDITFNKPEGNYALHAAEDVTQGRHIVKLDVLIPKLKKMLGEAADYLEENHMEMKQPDWKHGQTINRLLHTMSYMDVGSLEQVYNTIHDATTPRDLTIKNIFLGMVPNVGTTASSIFVRNVIRTHKVSDWTAVLMLSKLPIHVKVPSVRLLLEMEDLIRFGDSIAPEVRKASILCFASLLHKTFEHEQHTTRDIVRLDRYLQHFFEHVQNEPTYQMKMVYMMALKNVGVTNIIKLLEPVIRGDIVVGENPHHIRVQAIWAIKDVIAKDPVHGHDLLWPILSDVSLPLPVRIMAYDVLVDQLPTMARMMNLYWLMMHEKNEHMYHYHVTTMRTLAHSVDPCMRPVREMAMKILRFSFVRHVPGTLSTKYFHDYVDPKYGHGESLKTSLIYDELTGLPHMGSVQHFVSVGRRPVKHLGIHWMISGMEDILKDVKLGTLGGALNIITNENVKTVLMRAAQDMPAKKEIHADICITMNGLAVVSNHYDKTNWKKIFDDVKQWQQHVTDANVNWQSVVYDNLFEMQVATDMGLPAVLANRMPNLLSLKLNTLISEVRVPLNVQLKVDARMWRHGEYVMSIYNPISDVWHSIRRATSRDVSLPLEMTVGYNHETKSVKVTLPRLPLTKYSTAGISTHARNYVTVTEDETDVLKQSCPTCHHHQVVTTGTEKKTWQTVVDSKDTGLQYTMAIHNCENKVTPVTVWSEWLRVLSPEHKSTMGSKLAQFVMAARQQAINDMISPELGNCGTLVKIEPSIVHPTAHIDMNMRVNVEDLDHIHDTLHIHSSKKVNVRGTVDVKAASTNASTRLWDINVSFDLSQGHVNNNLKMQITRVVPGEKNLKICLDAQKNYPVIDGDLLKLGTTKEETNMKMTITAGQTDEHKCTRDETVITMTIKGEMSEEQKKHITHDSTHGACAKDMQNELFQTSKGYIPKTWSCLHETILHTTLRKYTVNVAHKKVPQNVLSTVYMMEDIVRALFLPHVRYVSGTTVPFVKMNVEYPVGTHHVDANIATEHTTYDLVELPFGHPIWDLFMDNTRFSVPFLWSYVPEDARLCTIYPQVLLTLDNGTIPFVVSDQWTLISGDYVSNTYAVFVKAVQPNTLAVKVYVGEHDIEIVPTDNKMIVHVNGSPVDHPEKGVMVPADEPDTYALKLTNNYEHTIVNSQRVPFLILTTPNSVSIYLRTSLQGQVTGMCGHMDNTHKEKIPKIYSVAHL